MLISAAEFMMGKGLYNCRECTFVVAFYQFAALVFISLKSYDISYAIFPSLIQINSGCACLTASCLLFLCSSMSLQCLM